MTDQHQAGAQRVAVRYIRKQAGGDVAWGLREIDKAFKILQGVETLWGARGTGYGEGSESIADVSPAVSTAVRTMDEFRSKMGPQLRGLKNVKLGRYNFPKGTLLALITHSRDPRYAPPVNLGISTGGDRVTDEQGLKDMDDPRWVKLMESRGQSIDMPLAEHKRRNGWEEVQVIIPGKGKFLSQAYMDRAFFKWRDNYYRQLAGQKSAAGGQRLPPAIKNKVNKALARAGLDGQKYDRPGKLYSTAVSILSSAGIELAETGNWDTNHPPPRVTLRLAFTNAQDLFSPVPISNSMLVVTFHEMDSGRYEVVAYLS